MLTNRFVLNIEKPNFRQRLLRSHEATDILSMEYHGNNKIFAAKKSTVIQSSARNNP